MQKYRQNDGRQIIYIETSGRGYLDTREACAIESGARSSNLKRVEKENIFQKKAWKILSVELALIF